MSSFFDCPRFPAGEWNVAVPASIAFVTVSYTHLDVYKRQLLGSTAKMGAGTNVQDRLIALHDLDCPWRPSALPQRLGRIVRQGNEKDVYKRQALNKPAPIMRN